MGPVIASLMFWALKSLRCPTVLGPKFAFYWELLYKKLPLGGVVIWPCMVLNLGGSIHNLGYLNGVALQPSPVLGPNRTRCRSCVSRAQNRLGLQGNPIQIPVPLVMDTAA